MAIEVRSPKIADVPSLPPIRKTRAGSRFLSAVDSEPGPRRASRGNNSGRPVNPKGTGRKINTFGSQETQGFEDYTTDLHFSDLASGFMDKSGFGPIEASIFRPWIEDTARWLLK